MPFLINPSSLKTRVLEVNIALVTGEFQQGGNVKTVNNLTVNAEVQKTMSNNFTNSAVITIFGMNKQDIASLTTTGYAPLIYEQNKIELYANYSDEAKSLCFSGFIVKAYPDYNNTSRPMIFECQATYEQAINNVQSFNAQKTSAVPDIFNNLAKLAGLSFSNNGVGGQIDNCILTGSVIDQMKQLAKQTNTNCVIDNNKLYIAPQGSQMINDTYILNAGSGLLGYPITDNLGIKCKTRYIPQIQLGQYVTIESEVYIPKSTGNWFIYDINHSLNNRHENWYSNLRCSYDPYQQVI